MESRIVEVRAILNRLADQNGGSPRHSGKGRFWNLPRDQFVNSPISGKTPIVPGDSGQSFLVKILQGSADGVPRMPLGGPDISEPDLTFIVPWINDGAPDADDVARHDLHVRF